MLNRHFYIIQNGSKKSFLVLILVKSLRFCLRSFSFEDPEKLCSISKLSQSHHSLPVPHYF